MKSWEQQFEAFLAEQNLTDSSHGIDHIRRVRANARRIGPQEGARDEILIPAVWLHDCVQVEKDSPDRSKASRLAAEKARAFLESVDYPAEFLDDISHAIEAHSFSAGIEPETVEAKVLQDADRLDALGAIGLARCMMVGERLGLPLYNPDDPFAWEREPDDKAWIIDHFYVKLFTLPETMQTNAGREEAERRAQFLRTYLNQLGDELNV